jgi:hypothetical protein
MAPAVAQSTRGVLRSRVDPCELLPCLTPPSLPGLMYEWLHYIVHTRWTPPAGWRGKWLREVRRHHMLHHMRNEGFWLSFSAPAGEVEAEG